MMTGQTCLECYSKGAPYSETCQMCNVQGPLTVDGRPVEIAGIEQNNQMRFLGAAPDGCFYVSGKTGAEDRVVQHYSPDGRLLGLARPPKSHFCWLASLSESSSK